MASIREGGGKKSKVGDVFVVVGMLVGERVEDMSARKVRGR